MDEPERRWLTLADARVIALRVVLLGVVAPLLAVGFDALTHQGWADRLAARLTGHSLASPPPWFWRVVLFMAVAVVLPVSLVERLAANAPGAARRAGVAGLVAGLVAVPGAFAALAQAKYAPSALRGDVAQGSALALDALAEVFADGARVVVGAALAFMAPFLATTWCRLRAAPLVRAWPGVVLVTAVAAALSLGVVAGLPPLEWLKWRTDFWTPVAAAFLLPPAFALVDRVLGAPAPGGVPSGPLGVD